MNTITPSIRLAALAAVLALAAGRPALAAPRPASLAQTGDMHNAALDYYYANRGRGHGFASASQLAVSLDTFKAYGLAQGFDARTTDAVVAGLMDMYRSAGVIDGAGDDAPVALALTSDETFDVLVKSGRISPALRDEVRFIDRLAATASEATVTDYIETVFAQRAWSGVDAWAAEAFVSVYRASSRYWSAAGWQPADGASGKLARPASLPKWLKIAIADAKGAMQGGAVGGMIGGQVGAVIGAVIGGAAGSADMADQLNP